MNLDILSEYIQPQLLILVPMLWGIGMAVKRSSIKNKYIPLILLVSACLVSALHLGSLQPMFDVQCVMSWLFASVTQGSVIWLTAWVSYEKVLRIDNEPQSKQT